MYFNVDNRIEIIYNVIIIKNKGDGRMNQAIFKEEELLESQEVREKFLERVDILEKIKALVLLPNTDFMTTKAVAEYFEVTQEVIRDNIRRSREELESNGMKEFSYNEIKSLIGSEKISRPKIKQLGINTARATNVFSKRAVLNIGMLLRDSEIAKELRNNILNTYQAAPDEIKLSPIEREKELALGVLFNESDEDRVLAFSRYKDFKDQHINQLEHVIEKQEPKVKIHDQLMAAVDTVSIIFVAKNIGVGEYKLFEFLRATKILFKEGGENYPYQQYQNQGYFKVISTIKQDKYGRDHINHTTKVTGSGKVFILNLVNKYGGAEVINNLPLKEIKKYVKNFESNLTKTQ